MRLLLSSVCAGILALPTTSLRAQSGNQSNAGIQTTVMPAVDFHPHETTTLPEAARYEIMQSSFAAKVTLRLDRWSGAVDQMVQRSDSSITWQAVQREINPVRDQQLLAQANYQIFSSGIAIVYTFLINSNTGATWQLTEDPAHVLFWVPVY
jgi:hypothetical protein